MTSELQNTLDTLFDLMQRTKDAQARTQLLAECSKLSSAIANSVTAANAAA
jgi:hypothetical protein